MPPKLAFHFPGEEQVGFPAQHRARCLAPLPAPVPRRAAHPAQAVAASMTDNFSVLPTAHKQQTSVFLAVLILMELLFQVVSLLFLGSHEKHVSAQLAAEEGIRKDLN